MAAPVDETVAPEEETSTQQSEAADLIIESEFFDKVSQIPVVNTAKEYSTNVYKSVKGWNMFTVAAFNVVENTALYVAHTTKPVLNKFQPQVKAIDRLACKGLVLVEEKAPFVKKPSEEIVGDTKQLITSTVERTLGGIKDFGEQKMNNALQETENLVNRFIPPTSEESSTEEKSEPESVTQRATNLLNRTGVRLYVHGMKNIKPLQDLTNEYAPKILYILPFGLDQTALSMIRNTTSGLVQVYNTTIDQLSYLPTNKSQFIQTATTYATELLIQLDKKTNAGQHTLSCLQALNRQLINLEERIRELKTEEIEMESLETDEAFSESVSSPS